MAACSIKMFTIKIKNTAYYDVSKVIFCYLSVGYFRDEIGAYDWMFYGIFMFSTASSVSWIFAPHIEKCRRKRWFLPPFDEEYYFQKLSPHIKCEILSTDNVNE